MVLERNPELTARLAAGLEEQALDPSLISTSDLSDLRLPPTRDSLQSREGIRGALERAEEMLDSYRFDSQTGIATFTIPSGLGDIDAMLALNSYFLRSYPDQGMGAISAAAMEWFKERLVQRDSSHSRAVTITALVPGTDHKTREEQRGVLDDRGLEFSDMRDQALAAALHACTQGAKDLFESNSVVGLTPGFGLMTLRRKGVSVCTRFDNKPNTRIFASGSARIYAA